MEWLKKNLDALVKKLDYLTGRKFVAGAVSNVVIFLALRWGYLDGLEPLSLCGVLTAPWVVVAGGQSVVDFAKARLLPQAP